MKEQRDAMIVTETAAAATAVLSKLNAVGIGRTEELEHHGDYIMVSESLSPTGGRQYYNFREHRLTGVECDVYHHSQLTPEILQSLPGAKPLPPGPWKFEGRMWEIDGDEKRVPVTGDHFLHKVESDTVVHTSTCGDFLQSIDVHKRWILRPVITAALQAAMSHQQQTAKVVSEARKANREAMDKVAELKFKAP